MTNIVLKLRDLLADSLKYIPDDVQDYITSSVFALQYANISSLVVTKGTDIWGMTYPIGTAVTWTRSVATVTVTKTAHGLITGDSITFSSSSDATALPNTAHLVTKLTANTFSVVGLSAGASSGTVSYPAGINYSYSSTTGKVTILGTIVPGEVLTFSYYAYEKYSDTELQGYIRSALYYLSAEKYKTFTIRPPTFIFPTLTESEECLVAIVAAILINGSINQYRTPEFQINFTENLSVSKRIKLAVGEFKKSFGVMEYVDLEDEPAEIDDDEE